MASYWEKRLQNHRKHLLSIRIICLIFFQSLHTKICNSTKKWAKNSIQRNDILNRSKKQNFKDLFRKQDETSTVVPKCVRSSTWVESYQTLLRTHLQWLGPWWAGWARRLSAAAALECYSDWEETTT